jgi:hypothetical protein
MQLLSQSGTSLLLTMTQMMFRKNNDPTINDVSRSTAVKDLIFATVL